MNFLGIDADPLKRASAGGTGDGPSGSRTRCRFPTIGKHQQALEHTPRVGQAFWQPLRLSTALTGASCKNATKVSPVLYNRTLRIPRAPGEELKEHTPGQSTATPGRRKNDLWIAWISTAVLRGWRMFEPDSASSKKIWFGFGSTALAVMTTATKVATQPASLPTAKKTRATTCARQQARQSWQQRVDDDAVKGSRETTCAAKTRR